jgi:hypothetical protein
MAGAERATRRALTLDRAHEGATATLANFLRLTGRSAEADELLQGILARNPAATMIRTSMAADMMLRQRPGDALALLDQPTPSDPLRRAHWRLQRSLALTQLGRTDEARIVLDALRAEHCGRPCAGNHGARRTRRLAHQAVAGKGEHQIQHPPCDAEHRTGRGKVRLAQPRVPGGGRRVIGRRAGAASHDGRPRHGGHGGTCCGVAHHRVHFARRSACFCRVAAVFLAEAARAAAGRDAAALSPSFPPLRAGAWPSGLPRPEPDFLPPPVSLFTVAQARRSASGAGTPRASSPSSMCSAWRTWLPALLRAGIAASTT